MSDLPRDTEFELAALADGSLKPEQRERVLGRVQSSCELQAALAEQQHAVGLTAAVDVKASVELHQRVEAMIAPAEHERRRGRPRWRIGIAVAAGAALAAGVIAIGLATTSGGGSQGFGVKQAAALTLSSATMPAPRESKTDRAQLSASVEGVRFPYWGERFGWHSSGARSDDVGGRSVRTIFYSNGGGKRVGYAIASGQAPSTPGGTIVKRWGVSYRISADAGANVVSWERDGHLCVVSGKGVSTHTLVSLASWGSEKPRST
jgi:hypothetical protein